MGQNSIQGRVEEEFRDAALGDDRLNKRLLKLVKQLESNTTAPISQACENWADTKAAYRFFDNENISYQKIHLPHQARTIQRAECEDRIFCIQDTTSISYSGHPKTEGLCQLSGKFNYGILMHSGFLVNEKSEPLGLGYLKIWSRGETARSQGIYHRFVPIEKKESFKWVECQRQMRELLPNKEVITLGDRECDIYEFMMEAEQTQMKFVVRAKSDRGVNKKSKRSIVQETLWPHMEKMKLRTVIEIEVPREKISVSVECRRESRLIV